MRKEKLLTLIKIGLYAVLATPLFFHQSFIFPFLVPKVFVFQALIEFTFAFWLVLVLFCKEYRPKKTAITIALVVFLGALLVSSFLGVDLSRSLWSSQARSLGLVSLFHFAALFLMLSSVSPKLNWRAYLSFSFLVSFVAALFVVVQLLLPQFFLEQVANRPGSFLGNPAFLASYLLFHIFIGLWLAWEYFRFARESARYRMLAAFFILASLFELIVVFFTQTRGAIVGFGLGFVALLLGFAMSRGVVARIWKFDLRKVALSLLLVIFFGALIFFFTREAPFWQTVPGVSRFTAISFESRELLPRRLTLGIAWQSFLDRPLLGFGFENFRYPFDYHYDPRLLRINFIETYFDKPHNVFLEYLVTGGIIGFLSYLALLVAAFYTLIHADRKPIRADTTSASISQNQHVSAAPYLWGALVAYLGQNLFLFDTFGSYLMFFVVLAFVDARTRTLIYADEKLINADQQKSAKISINQRYMLPVTAVFILSALILVYFLNVRTLYANNRQYWGLNFFLNRQPFSALESYMEALTTPTPYRDAARADFALVLSQMLEQGVLDDVPEVQKFVSTSLSELAKAIENKPNDYFLRQLFAEVSTTFSVFDEKLLEVAEKQLEAAQRLSPRRQQVYYALAKIKVLRGSPSEAKELMEQAVALDPEAGDPHFYYGLLALEAREWELGFRELRKARELGRDYRLEEARILANYYAEFGDYERAKILYAQALQASPFDIDSQLKLGLVNFYLGRYDEARREIEAVLKTRPDLRESPQFEVIRSVVESLGL